MALFRRRRRSDVQATTIAARLFWAWWEAAHDEITAAADAGDTRRLATLLTLPVREIHPELTWHVGSGRVARYSLVLSGARRPALRVATERWRRAGPADSTIWEFHPSRPAEPEGFEEPTRIGGVQLTPAEASAVVTSDDMRFRLDLDVFHPVFAQLDEPGRARVAGVLVGRALGEDDTDRWIGRITPTCDVPDGAVPVSRLGSLASALKDRWSGERWVTLEGAFGMSKLVAVVRHPLHRVDHPLFDEHVTVSLRYEDTLPDGQPTPAILAELEGFERHILARLGSTALLVAVQTASGERLMHFYADSEQIPLSRFSAMLRGYTGGPASAQARFDPAWDGVDHLRIASAPG
jgi:hypothetical protein